MEIKVDMERVTSSLTQQIAELIKENMVLRDVIRQLSEEQNAKESEYRGPAESTGNLFEGQEHL